MTQPSQLSPAAEAIWEAFNDVSERVGVFEDYGDALAAALRALADQAVPLLIARTDRESQLRSDRSKFRMTIRAEILAIADELEGR